MAISLNTVNNTVTNHETRIKALENKATSNIKSLTLTTLWTGSTSGNLTIAALANYSLIIVVTTGRHASFLCVKGGGYFGPYDDSGDAVFDWVRTSWSGTTLTNSVRSGRATNVITKVIGIG